EARMRVVPRADGHLDVPEDRHAFHGRGKQGSEVVVAGGEEDLAAAGETFAGLGPITGDEHACVVGDPVGRGIDPEVPVVLDRSTFQPDNQPVATGGGERVEGGTDVAERMAFADGNVARVPASVEQLAAG